MFLLGNTIRCQICSSFEYLFLKPGNIFQECESSPRKSFKMITVPWIEFCASCREPWEPAWRLSLTLQLAIHSGGAAPVRPASRPPPRALGGPSRACLCSSPGGLSRDMSCPAAFLSGFLIWFLSSFFQ